MSRRGAFCWGENLLDLPAGALYDICGRRVAMIFQEPMTALNPLMKVSAQIEKVFEAHGLLSTRERKKRALELLEEVGLPDPARAAVSYPFQLSGGQRQRVMIAMPLALEPEVLIADEPTTALDVTTQAQILETIDRLQRTRNMAVMFITYDFGVVAEIADQVAVMQHGRIVERGTADEVLLLPQHSYTHKLIAAIPSGTAPEPTAAKGETHSLLKVENLSKIYFLGSGLFGKQKEIHAVKEVSFQLERGETLGIVGESGSGKSSVGRCLVRLQDPNGGKILLDGEDIASLKGEALRTMRRRIQMIFQDPYSSLNPREKVGQIVVSGPIAFGTDPATALEEARAKRPERFWKWSSSMRVWRNVSRTNFPAVSASASPLRVPLP